MQNDLSSTAQELVVENLSKRYGSRVVVDSLRFRLGAGEVLGLLGPNGAGKTTSVAMLYGAVLPDSGSSFLEPMHVRSSSSLAMRSIGIVTQVNTLDPDFDVRTNLQLFGKYHGVPKDILHTRIERLLERFELTAYAEYRIHALSGGLERRAVLARALVHEPQFIFLDEPTTGFDPDVRQLFWRLILSLKDEGKSILLTTHYMDEAQRLCDRLLLLQEGRVLDEGIPQDLIARWVGAEVIEVEGLDRTALRHHLGERPIVSFARGYITELRAAEEIPKLQSLGAVRVQQRLASLEDVFLALQQGIRRE